LEKENITVKNKGAFRRSEPILGAFKNPTRVENLKGFSKFIELAHKTLLTTIALSTKLMKK
jgi:hypothetical protein